MLLACDGLFDVYSTEEVIEIVRTEMALDGDVQRTCEVLTEHAISKRYSRDNVSVVSPQNSTDIYIQCNELVVPWTDTACSCCYRFSWYSQTCNNVSPKTRNIVSPNVCVCMRFAIDRKIL